VLVYRNYIGRSPRCRPQLVRLYLVDELGTRALSDLERTFVGIMCAYRAQVKTAAAATKSRARRAAGVSSVERKLGLEESRLAV
jgi:hypothetical protein